MSDEGSESDSSDSSNEFLVSPDQIKSLSPFFTKPLQKKTAATITAESSEESDFEDDNETQGNNADLMAEVLKNLEATKRNEFAPSPASKSGANPKAVNSPIKKNQKNVITSPKKELTTEIADLLLLGETGATASTSNENHDEPEQDLTPVAAPSNYSIPKEGVKITLVEPSLIFNQRKKKKQETIEDLLKKKLNQQLRTNQVFLHKVGLLCWLAHGFYVNKQINNPILLSSALKFAPKNCYPKGRVDLAYLEKITKWFLGMFTNVKGKEEQSITTLNLLKRLRDKEVYNYQELVLLYIAVLRALGLTCRLVISLQPPALKVTRDQLIAPEIVKKENGAKEKSQVKKKGDSKSSKTGNAKTTKEEKNPKSPVKVENEKTNISTRLRRATDARERAAQILKRKKKDASSDASSDDNKPPAKKLALRSRTVAAKPEPATKTRGRTAENKNKEEEDAEKKSTRSLRSRAKTADKHWPKNKKNDDEDDDDEYKMSDDQDEDEDEEDELFDLKTSRSRSRSSSSKRVNDVKTPAKRQSRSGPRKSSTARKLISSDEEYEIEDEKANKPRKQGKDFWVEVYVESEENWISVSVPDGKIHCTIELYKNASDPVLYVMAWNSEGQVRDVTRRYCPHWLTLTRKQRIDEKWWLEAHTPWKEPETARTKAEDEMLKQKELEQPLPKTVSECKGHPLYVLPRHLLKFEALYPPDVVPLGYVRGEPIYSRHCVHTLCSRETWVKNARVVRAGEQCYKVVKARPKFDKLSGARLKDEALEVFGKWQTDQYVPPEAKNGIVPRNEYGNVDLFKECMLPKGTVHIQLPALNRIARKLDIDCVPAVVGFNFGGHGALPAFDGYIVCEEFEDVLREAWEVEQVEADKRAKERYEKRVYGNWRKLIKAALIRERLTAKYDFNNEAEKASVPNKQTNKRTNPTRGGGKKAKVNSKK